MFRNVGRFDFLDMIILCAIVISIVATLLGLSNSVVVAGGENCYEVSDSVITDSDYEYVIHYIDYAGKDEYIYFNVIDSSSDVGSFYRGSVYTSLRLEGGGTVYVSGGSCHISIDNLNVVTSDFIIEQINVE